MIMPDWAMILSDLWFPVFILEATVLILPWVPQGCLQPIFVCVPYSPRETELGPRAQVTGRRRVGCSQPGKFYTNE